jgi:hypothetical protein
MEIEREAGVAGHGGSDWLGLWRLSNSLFLDEHSGSPFCCLGANTTLRVRRQYNIGIFNRNSGFAHHGGMSGSTNWRLRCGGGGTVQLFTRSTNTTFLAINHTTNCLNVLTRAFRSTTLRLGPSSLPNLLALKQHPRWSEFLYWYVGRSDADYLPFD